METMNAVVTREAGRPDVLELQQRQIPAVGANSVLIKVTATTVNKIDLTERRKHGGIILGHECSGIIEKVGTDVKGWKVNDKVCALLPGGQGYAEYVSVPSDMLFPIPQCVSLKLAASLPLLSCTTFHAFFLCGLKEGETLLLHDDDYDNGEDGIFALRLAKALYKTRVFVVSGDPEKLKRYKHYGADECFNLMDGARCYNDVISRTKDRGVDVVINYGGDKVIHCVRCMTLCGNMMVICNVEDKRSAEFDIHDLRESSTTFIVCDPRILMTLASAGYKSRLVRDVSTNVFPLFNDGKIGCEEHKTLPLSKAMAAHKLMEESKANKIILTINDEPQESPKDWSYCLGEYIRAAAVVLEKFGGPDVLKVTNLKCRTPGDNEVLINVLTMAVNHIDLLRREGKLVADNNNMRLGYDCCGVIILAGAKVKKFRPGDEVCALLEGEGYADFVVAHETMVFRTPPDPKIGWEMCALFPYAGAALMLSLDRINPMERDGKILIHGGAGGLGSLAVRFAKHMGLKVFATVELKEHMEFCRKLGVDVCINSTLEIYSEKVLDETERSGVDCILDCSTRDNVDIDSDINCLANNGSLIFMGNQMSKVKLDLVRIAEKGIRLVGSNFSPFPKGDIEELLQRLEKMWPAIADIDFETMVCKTFHIDEVQAAHELMESKQHAGRIVLTTYRNRSMWQRQGY